MKRKLSSSAALLVAFFVFTACSPQTETDIAEILGATETHFEQVDGITTTASSYNEKQIKFRLVVDRRITEKEALVLLNSAAEELKKNAANPSLWKDFAGHLDIKSLEEGVLYTATTDRGTDFKISSDGDVQ